jgi:hypothetical protein
MADAAGMDAAGMDAAGRDSAHKSIPPGKRPGGTYDLKAGAAGGEAAMRRPEAAAYALRGDGPPRGRARAGGPGGGGSGDWPPVSLP